MFKLSVNALHLLYQQDNGIVEVKWYQDFSLQEVNHVIRGGAKANSVT